MNCNNATLVVEIRKSHFGKKLCQIHLYYQDGMEIQQINQGVWSREATYAEVKKYLHAKNVDCPNAKDIRWFSDGFEYDYAYFDGYGKVAGNITSNAA